MSFSLITLNSVVFSFLFFLVTHVPCCCHGGMAYHDLACALYDSWLMAALPVSLQSACMCCFMLVMCLYVLVATDQQQEVLELHKAI